MQVVPIEQQENPPEQDVVGIVRHGQCISPALVMPVPLHCKVSSRTLPSSRLSLLRWQRRRRTCAVTGAPARIISTSCVLPLVTEQFNGLSLMP